MLMKEKMPLMSTTPIPTPSAAIAADAKQQGPSTTGDEGLPPEPEVEIAVGEPEAEPDTAPEVQAGESPKMRAHEVSVSYGDKQALNKVSIDIHDDRVTSFIGPSG